MKNRIAPVLLALSGITASPVLAAEPQPPTPSNNPGEWVTTADYPSEAFGQGTSGTVGFRVIVARDGKVSNCQVISGSGSQALDEATCRLVSFRARFTPARDGRGNPVEGAYSNRVRWVLPPGSAPRRNPQAGLLIFSALVSPDGKISDCRIEQSEGSNDQNMKVGPLIPCGMADLPQGYTDSNGKPVAKRFRRTIKVELLDVPTEQAAPLPDQPAAVPGHKG